MGGAIDILSTGGICMIIPAILIILVPITRFAGNRDLYNTKYNDN